MQTPKLVAVEKHIHTVPVALALQLVELLKRWHIPDVELLSGVRLGPNALEDPLGRLPVSTMHDLLERARLMTGEPGLGYYLGLQKRVSLYGYPVSYTHLDVYKRQAASCRAAAAR